MIKKNNILFDPENVVDVEYVESTPETTTLLYRGGGTRVFTGDAAHAVWNWYLSKITLEL